MLARPARYNVAGIGNAIVDVLASTDDAFLNRHALAKGHMSLIDAPQADALYRYMRDPVERSGGSAANTIAGLASLRTPGAFIGKVATDALGDTFARDLRAAGIHFDTPALEDGATTARCLIWVTPDGQRTMTTYLGACVELGPEDIEEATIATSCVTYLEGYLWDPPRAKQAFLKAARIAHESGNEVALSLSDAFCVNRHRHEFQELVSGHVDILFANEHEIMALYETTSFDEVVRLARDKCATCVLTRSEKGSVVVTPDEVLTLPAEPVARVVDTTGAGDLFAAGFLHGYTQDRPLAECCRIAALTAAEVITHFGARPETDLHLWIQQHR